MKSFEFLSGLTRVLEEEGLDYEVGKSVGVDEVRPDVYFVKKGRAALIVPYEDNYYCFDFDKEGHLSDVEHLRMMHEANKKYSERNFKLPRAMRFKVPVTVSLFVSANGFDDKLIREVKKSTATIIGGEANAMFLIDLRRKTFYGQDSREYRLNANGIPLNLKMKNTDPINRSIGRVIALSEQIQRIR